jgi:hypothetical protein
VLWLATWVHTWSYIDLPLSYVLNNGGKGAADSFEREENEYLLMYAPVWRRDRGRRLWRRGEDGGSGEYRDANERAAEMVAWTMGVVLGTISTMTGTAAAAARVRRPWQGWHPMQAGVRQRWDAGAGVRCVRDVAAGVAGFGVWVYADWWAALIWVRASGLGRARQKWKWAIATNCLLLAFVYSVRWFVVKA